MGKNRRSKEFKNNSQVIDMEAARKERLARRREERAKAEKKAKVNAKQNSRGKMAIRRQRNRRRIAVFIIVLLVIAFVGVCMFKIISLKKEQSDTLKQQEELKKEKAELEEELANASDAENIEEQARSQLRLIKSGEVLYMISDEITQAAGDEEQSSDED